MNSNPSSQSPTHNDSSSRLLLQKISEQISQQIQNLLSYLNMQNSGQINFRLVEKCIASTKTAILRALSVRLPQIVAIEEKCRGLVVEIGQELDGQRGKVRELQKRHEGLVLECDRYKMETVQINQMYEALYNENLQLKLNMSKAKEQKYSQTDPDPEPLAHRQLAVQLTEQQEQREEERELYHEELSKNAALIDELRKNQQAANQRIANLLEQIRDRDGLVQEYELTAEIMRKEVSDLVVEVEKLKEKIEEDADKFEEEKGKIERHYKYLMQLSKGAQNALSKNLSQISSAMRQVELEYSELHDQYTQLKQASKQNQKKISSLQEQQKKFLSQISQLQSRNSKIKDITKNQQNLQRKYNKKIELLSRQVKELGEKNKFYKNQNERLYEAMDQYAGKELKLNNHVGILEGKIKGLQDRELAMGKLKAKMREACGQMKKEIELLRKSVHGERERNIRSLLTAFKESFEDLKGDFETKLARKLAEIQKERAQQHQNLKSQLETSQQHYKHLQQKTLESELSSNRVASSLLDSKNKISSQLIEKDQIIRALEAELRKERELSQQSSRKLAEVVRKYRKVQLEDIKGTLGNIVRDGEDLELESFMIQQRNRLIGLQKQYKSFIQK